MYFKVIQESKVVSVGSVFLKWNINKHRMFVCNPDIAQFVQAFDESKIYKDTWLKQAPEEATGYEYAEVVIIGEQEYIDLKALLEEDEEIPVQEVTPEVVPQSVVEPAEEEKPMSIAEMREIIIKQQEQIDKLTQAISN